MCDSIKPANDRMEEYCGVFGIYDTARTLNTAETAYFGLYALQHRGQESAGIAVTDGSGINHVRNKGLVPEVFAADALASLRGHIAIGHVRYSTFGNSDVINAQPLVARCRMGALALAHNGSLVNANALRAALEEKGAIFQTTVDSEVLINLLARMHGERTLEEAITHMMRMARGSYALVMMTERQLIGIRDPHGIRPLALGKLEGNYVLASESCAFDAVGAEFVRDIQPGEVVIIDENGLRSFRVPAPLESKLCVFEFVYFARPDSNMNGVSVYAARKDMGRRLAQLDAQDNLQADMVIGVPDSALPAAIGYAEASGIPYGDGLAKNRYVGRTFIQPEQGMRELGVRTKLNAMTRNVRGKRIIMIDDSIVRGTTSRKIVDMLRMAGAREVHIRISSPPVIHPCYFGIDTPSSEELIGATRSVQAICDYIGADSLKFLDLNGLLRTVEDADCGFCTGCFDGVYPMEPQDTATLDD